MQCLLKNKTKQKKTTYFTPVFYFFFLQDPTASLDLVDLDDTPAPDPVGTFAGWKRKRIYIFRLGERHCNIVARLKISTDNVMWTIGDLNKTRPI